MSPARTSSSSHLHDGTFFRHTCVHVAALVLDARLREQPERAERLVGVTRAEVVRALDGVRGRASGDGDEALLGADSASPEWTSWAAQNPGRARATTPVTVDLTIKNGFGFVRPTGNTGLGGWYFKTVFPGE